MLEALYHLILRKTAFLYTVLLQTPFFFFDLWSFVHLFSGAGLILILEARRVRRPFAALFVVLVGYECLELAFIYLSIRVFLPENLPDQVTDVWVGMLGGLAGWYGRRRWSRSGGLVAGWWIRPLVRDLAVAVTVSAAWVGFYGYRYNVPVLNSPLINWWAFLLWSGGLFAWLRFFDWLFGAISPRWLAITAAWAAYVCSLFTVEYVGYVVLGIHELRGGRPLAFDLIHGTVALRLYYPVAGLLAILFAAALERVAGRRNAPSCCQYPLTSTTR